MAATSATKAIGAQVCAIMAKVQNDGDAIIQKAQSDGQAIIQKSQGERARLFKQGHGECQRLLAELAETLDDQEQSREKGQNELDQEKEAFFKMRRDVQTKFASTLQNSDGEGTGEKENENGNENDNENESGGVYRFEASDKVKKAVALKKCTFTETGHNNECQAYFLCKDCYQKNNMVY